jgi:single-strand DNA-binding protein
MSAITTLVGNTTADIELRYTQNGKAVGNVTIVVQDRKLNRQTNEWEDGDKWFARCTLWGEIAEHAAASITKGTRVIAEGRIAQREYEDRDGNKRSSIEVTLDEIGPSLRYATAQITRSQGQGGGRPKQSDPYAGQTDYTQQNGPQTGAQDAWATTSVPDDDRPF